MTQTMKTETPAYYRTVKGSHRHVDFYCANIRRSIHLGDVVPMTAAEATDFAPCDVCCGSSEVKAAATAAAAKAAAMCANQGVTHPKRIQSACRSCGKVGKVNRSTGSLNAHKPA